MELIEKGLYVDEMRYMLDEGIKVEQEAISLALTRGREGLGRMPQAKVSPPVT